MYKLYIFLGMQQVTNKKTKDELLFNSYKKKVQLALNNKNISENINDYQYELAYCYMNGIGVTINHIEALYYFKISAEKGHMKSQYYLATYYEDGIYIEKNIEEAVKWCTKSAKQNYNNAQNLLGCYYEIGKYIKKNVDEAFNLYKKSAIQGNISAQYNLASCYEYGTHSGGKNMEEAVKWYTKSAEQNYHRSQNNLGYLYENGLGTEKNMTEAIKWYKKSSKQDNCKAHYNLGNCYKYNKGIEKNDINLKIAFKLYNRAIEQGCKCEDTVYEYALCYENGEGVEKDIVRAFTLYKQVADLDYPIGCYKLAECYKFGKGTDINNEKSMKWFDKAKNLGYELNIIIDSQKNLVLNEYLKTSPSTYDEHDLENPVCKDDSIFDDNDDTIECPECNIKQSENIDINKLNIAHLSKDEILKQIEITKLKIDNDEKMIIELNVKNNDSKTQIEILKNESIELFKQENIVKNIPINNKLNIDNVNKKLLYYKKKLAFIIQYKIENNIYITIYNENEYKNLLNKPGLYTYVKTNEFKNQCNYNSSCDLNYLTIEYLRNTYNCGVLHHLLRNYEKAIEYYEEAAYNKYPLAQKALSYCYKNGIYYKKSLEKSKIWYNLYLINIFNKNKYIEDVD
jgi:TPR repeat protein